MEVNPGTRALPYYGKATGPGPWHLLASPDATTALCGRRCRYNGRVANGRHCRPCRTAAQQLAARQGAEER